MTHGRVVFTGCTCWSGALPHAPTHALAIEAGRVQGLGDAALASGGRRLDLKGRTILPGLIDSHCHLTAAASHRLRVGLGTCASLEAAVDAVARWALAHPEDEWIRGWGWDHWAWERPALPSRLDLDRVIPDRPVWLTRRDGHSAWLNTAAMERLGLPSSAPADLLPLDEHDVPRGIVRETLMDDLAAMLPPYPLDLHAHVVRDEEAHLLSEGIVGVHTVERTRGIDVLRHAAEHGGLRIRLYVMAEGVAPEEAATHGLIPSPAAFKLFVDGSLGSGTAWMCGTSGATTGTPVTAGEELDGKVHGALDHRLDVCAHAIGDRAVREVLDVFERYRDSYPDRVFRIEHAQHVNRPDMPRLAGLFLSIQPCHLLSDRPMIARLPSRDDRRDYAYGSMARAGAHLLMGTDFPIEPSDPWRNIAAAMDRCGEGEDPWLPEERLSWPTVLEAYTRMPARAARWAGMGTLTPGSPANLIVVERDPGRQAPWHQHVCLTMVGGAVAFSDGSIDVE